MKNKMWRFLTIFLTVAVVASCAVIFWPSSSNIPGAGTTTNSISSELGDSNTLGVETANFMSLESPPFISTASAAEGQQAGASSLEAEGQRAGTTFLEEEAGISAYTNVGQEIDLAKAKTGFKTTEYETDEYIIGSVALPGLSETDDVHCYVHKDGWVAAYYLKEEPIAKIIDWNDLATTKLEEGLGEVCNTAGLFFAEAKYYDFRYPNAEKLMVIIDYDSFNLKIPSSFAVYERSYSFKSGYYNRSYLSIDGNEVVSVSSGLVAVRYGTLTTTQLKPDTFHSISVAGYEGERVAIVLAYKEG